MKSALGLWSIAATSEIDTASAPPPELPPIVGLPDSSYEPAARASPAMVGFPEMDRSPLTCSPPSLPVNVELPLMSRSPPIRRAGKVTVLPALVPVMVISRVTLVLSGA